MKKLLIILLSLSGGICFAQDSVQNPYVMGGSKGGHGPAVNPQTGQMYGTDNSDGSVQSPYTMGGSKGGRGPAVNPQTGQPYGTIPNPKLSGPKKQKLTISCNDGYSKEVVGQNGTYAVCGTSKHQECCNCLLAQAVCKDHRGVKGNGSKCSSMCSASDLGEVENEIMNKGSISSDDKSQLQNAITDAKTQASAR